MVAKVQEKFRGLLAKAMLKDIPGDKKPFTAVEILHTTWQMPRSVGRQPAGFLSAQLKDSSFFNRRVNRIVQS